MPLVPAINSRVRITCPDINGNSVAKQFNSVQALNFDYVKGMVEIVDVTGTFYFGILTLSTFTFTVTTGLGGTTNVVISA